ncbi:leucyl/phenylalanyl-tRNA--protein transferase [Aquipuribacter sp. SD81]|uniref:leucyl/phenylalanyl-tRNA--protein transferase n=1 Tax=Aquipuribacter sp. SD81 TaxID=3127703 RepID=UPI003017688D
MSHPFDRALDRAPDGQDLVCVGGALASGLLLEGYRRGVFAMSVRVRRRDVLGWFSPDPRGVLHPADVHESRSLRRSSRRFETRVDTAFDEVVAACADPSREGAWIDDDYRRAYAELHAAGHAHSVETWADGRLVGGLFGVAVGGLFAAESKFHRETDASKAAVVSLARLLAADPAGPRLVDVQWWTPHLGSLGVAEVRREEYRAALPTLLDVPAPACFTVTPDPPGDGRAAQGPSRTSTR